MTRPAGGFDDQARRAASGVEPVVAGVGVGLYQAAVTGEVFFGMLPATVGRVIEQCRRCRRAVERASSRT